MASAVGQWGKLVRSSLDDDDQSSVLDQWDANLWSAQGALFAGIAYDLGPAPSLAPAELYPHDEAPPPIPPAAQTPVENGSGDATAAVAASGNQDIDGVLSGVRWSDGFITYSDPNSTADYGGGYPSPNSLNGFSQVSAQQMVAVHFGLNSAIFTQPIGAAGFGVEGFTNLTIDYAGSGSGAGTIRVANSSDPGTAYAFYPSAAATGGDAFFGPSGDFPDAGDYDWHTVLHELGHSLGLKHGHETGVFGALPSDVDSLEFSIMTYRTYIGQPISGYSYEAFGAPQTFMMLDIAALQYMYGADYTTNSGNTVYTWSQTDGTTFVNGNVAIDPGGNRIFATIWDGGGTDTYDLSNYTTDLEINLAPGQWSTFSDTQLANLGGGPNGGFARGNIANALLFGGNNASLIENAIGGSGDDTIQGNDANNTLTGNAGDDILKGVGGADTLNGGSGNDTLKGGGGADTLNGGDGNDTLNGDDDADTVNGGNGDDRVVDADFVNFDVHDGGAGIDTIDYSGITFASGIVTINLATGQTSVSGGNTEQITNFENAEGSDGGETIIGNSLANVLNGNDGNDVIDGGSGNDVIDGGVGNDTINGGSGSDVLNGGDGNDTLSGGFFTDTVNGGNGDDTIIVLEGEFGDAVDGGSGTDTLNLSNVTSHGASVNLDAGSWDFTPSFGGPNAITSIETVSGTQADDVLTGTFGTQTLFGNGGNDRFVILDGRFGDNITGGTGTDTLDLSPTTSAAVVDLVAGTYTIAGFFPVWTIAGVENVLGTSAADTITGGGASESLSGNDGDDVLTGGSGADTISGGKGADLIQGGFATDVIDGGKGGDTIAVLEGEFIDNVDGGGGKDLLDLSAITSRAAVIDLNAGTWDLSPSFGGPATIVSVEKVVGTALGDTITGAAANETLSGGDGADVLNGGAGGDKLEGGAGNDTLDGGSQADTLEGGNGADRLVGGAGQDTITSAGGNDTIVLSPLGANRDTIQDFVSANDQFEISAALFGGGLVAGVLPASQFVVNGTGLAGDANDRFIYDNTNGELFYDSNGTAAGGSSLIATLTGIPGLASSDFTIV